MNNLVNYLTAFEPVLPPISAHLYEYILGGNGIFIRGRRQGFEIMWQITSAEIRGLPKLTPYFRTDFGTVPPEFLVSMLESAQNCDSEILWYLISSPWRLSKPPQKASHSRVEPNYSTLANSDYEKAVIEIHSHGNHGAYFSATDNADEQGFRIYAVLGSVHTNPTILVRVGLAGYFCPIQASYIFQLPPGIKDGYKIGY